MTLSAGILLVDKPPGVTSHDVVDWIRFVTRTPTGHAGTLDPAATGLLVVLLGAATKLSELFAAEDKTYVARFRLGLRTHSEDLDGEVLEQVDVDDEAHQRGLVALAGLQGEHQLSPPAVSAIHVDGERAHVRARRGESLELPTRPMTVFAVEGASLTRDGDLEATLRVSKGTYVRSLAVELGRRVGLPCTLSGLRRTHSGRFALDGSLPALTGLHVEARQRPDGVPAVRIRLAASVGADVDGTGEARASSPSGCTSTAGVGTAAESVKTAVSAASAREWPEPGAVPVLSREASRARIARCVLPLVAYAPFPCVHADDEVSQGWLRRLAMGQRLSAYEPELCARFSRPTPPERPPAPPPTQGEGLPPARPAGADPDPNAGPTTDLGAAPQTDPGADPGAESVTAADYAAIYGRLPPSPGAAPPEQPGESATALPAVPPTGPAARSGLGESVLVLCVWSQGGARLEPRRTIRGDVEPPRPLAADQPDSAAIPRQKPAPRS